MLIMCSHDVINHILIRNFLENRRFWRNSIGIPFMFGNCTWWASTFKCYILISICERYGFGPTRWRWQILSYSGISMDGINVLMWNILPSGYTHSYHQKANNNFVNARFTMMSDDFYHVKLNDHLKLTTFSYYDIYLCIFFDK